MSVMNADNCGARFAKTLLVTGLMLVLAGCETSLRDMGLGQYFGGKSSEAEQSTAAEDKTMHTKDKADAMQMLLSSRSIDHQGMMDSEQAFQGWGCTGNNISPDLMWENIPKEAKSLAITMYDPDAPTGSGWWHWIVYDLPADLDALSEGAAASLPGKAKTGRNDYGQFAYGGMCPPEGDAPHRYSITLWALGEAELGLDPQQVSAAAIGYNLNSRSIAKTQIIGKFGR